MVLNRGRVLLLRRSTGVDRNAEHYLKRWMPYAQEHGFAIAAPQFDKTTFPTSIQFQLGNTSTADGLFTDVQHWTFSCIEPLFDHILQHHPRWYTLPDPAISWPYGLKNSALTAKLQQSWQTSLAQELVLLLGDLDTSTNSKHLRQNTEAMSQGSHRFARGHTFFAAAKEAAHKYNISFGWRLVVVQDVGHSNKQMIPAAVKQLQQNQNWRSAGSEAGLGHCSP
eukprot:gene6050-6288_t